jgi:hypothetical protein
MEYPRTFACVKVGLLVRWKEWTQQLPTLQPFWKCYDVFGAFQGATVSAEKTASP